MSDRCSASITLGGTMTRQAFLVLAERIADESLSTDWDGPWFKPQDLVEGQPLQLMAHDVTGGQFEELEAWCVAHGVPFARWCGAYPGGWGAERVVYRGHGEPVAFIADEEDRVLVDRATVEALGSIEAVLAQFAAADFVVPPLVLED